MPRSWTRVLVLSAIALACRAGVLERHPIERPAPTYRPGRSIAESRLCECRECFDSACCSGSDESEVESAALGAVIRSCGRCVRRVWTARAGAACRTTMPRECCVGSESG
jgi:hypothetical protein